jgi:error-prone DNA polymerase
MSAEYAELHCLSDFSFQRGASSANELFYRALACGYAALAITDECSMAGIVRALEASRRTGVRLIVGTEVTLMDGLKLVLLAEDLQGYQNICRLITIGRRAAEKGEYRLTREDLASGIPGALALWIPGRKVILEEGHWVRDTFVDRAWLAIELHRDRNDARRLQELVALGRDLGLPLVAAGDVHMDVRRRRALQDVMTAIRHNLPVAEAGAHLFRNGERHLRGREPLLAIYGEALMAETLRIAARCRFRLDEVRYQYPAELVPAGHTPPTWLRQLTEEGIRWRWPDGISEKVRAQIEHELALVRDLEYEAYFLTVHDIVRHARSLGILCQGRGSAANSAICYALGVTEVDPMRMDMLMERFISRERNEPPDIDIDFEHERREEVIQYIYRRYSRERAALAATVISYRPKSAMRDVARALGIPNDQLEVLSSCVDWWSGDVPVDDRLSEAGFDPGTPLMRRIVTLTAELLGKPRHLSQHVGGFVICDSPLWTLVPVENAAMPERTVIQWDKDDLDTMRLLKVDCLALGMLTCIRKALDLINAHRDSAMTPASIPAEDPATYDMLCKADTLGVFQIESRAQMSFLPRMQPRCFYDLVIEVAIIRPGPIQGKMVHPFLRRRQGLETPTYPSKEIRAIYERTLGVPLFQEQVMRVAMVAAGYNAGEADELRRSMAAWKRRGNMDMHREKIIHGMLARGYAAEYAMETFNQIVGFSGYGFPESHAASFALLTYSSCWLRCHEHAAFACALLNSQPMGFYNTSQITQDVRRKGIEVRPVCAAVSSWDSILEGPDNPRGQPAIRLGFREIRGFPEAAARRIEVARKRWPIATVTQLCHAADLDRRERALLAEAGALVRLAGHRNDARWGVAGVEEQRPLFDEVSEVPALLQAPSVGEDMIADYAALGLTLGAHPMSLLRARLRRDRCLTSEELRQQKSGRRVRVGGLVTLRQRPATASGTTFVSLEDEAGCVQVIVWPDLGEVQRRELMGSRLMVVEGKWEWANGVGNLIAERLTDRTAWLGDLDTRSRDFH